MVVLWRQLALVFIGKVRFDISPFSLFFVAPFIIIAFFFLHNYLSFTVIMKVLVKWHTAHQYSIGSFCLLLFYYISQNNFLNFLF